MLGKSSSALKVAADRSDKILGHSESIKVRTASAGVETIDTKLIDKAIEVAAQIEQRIVSGIRAREITLVDLLGKELRPIPGTDPQQYMTRYIPFLDREIAPLQDRVLKFYERIVFCAAIDDNLLIPMHNAAFRSRHGPDSVWNATHGCNR